MPRPTVLAGAALATAPLSAQGLDASPITREQLQQVLVAGRNVPGTRLTSQQLQQRLERTIANPFTGLIARAEEARLTDMQADSIAILNHRFALDVNATWAPIARTLSQLPSDFDADAAWALVEKGYAETAARLRPLADAAKAVASQNR